MTRARVLMVQGASSHSGKTLLVAALCKIFFDAGYRVAPFKAQNMSLNSYITKEGLEIARAQALQAFAAGIAPEARMNPILLKPKGNFISQIMLLGKPYKDVDSRCYYSDFALKEGWKAVKRALSSLLADYEVVFIEGAGSPAEVNLYDVEIANMRVAEYAKSPVVIVGDIDRGGVFASLYGTVKLLKPRHRKLVKGFIINKFRGDLEVLKPGIEVLEKLTGIPTLGVIPYLEDLHLPDEDSVSLEAFTCKEASKDLVVAVIRLPRISNFTDFTPLRYEPDATLVYVKSSEELRDLEPSLVILPGTKNTAEDLAWLKYKGFPEVLARLRKRGVPVIGICGGFQMLGVKLRDPHGIEGGQPRAYRGLGLLEVETTFPAYRKKTSLVEFTVSCDCDLLRDAEGAVFKGYEIHMGVTRLSPGVKPAFKVIKDNDIAVERVEGAVSDDGLVLGTYIHGLFDNSLLRRAVLNFARRNLGLPPLAERSRDSWEEWLKSLDKLAEVVRSHVDLDSLCKLAGLPPV